MKKTRKMGMDAKLLLTVFVIVVSLCFGITYVSNRHLKKGLILMGGNETSVAANVADNMIDIDDIVQAVDNNDEELYNEILEKMQYVAEICELDRVFTLHKNGDSIYYGADTLTLGTLSDIGTIYEGDTDVINDVFAGNEYVQDYIDDNNEITAFKPMYDDNGDIIGVVGCTSDASLVNERIAYASKYIFIVVAINFVVAMLFCFRMVKKITKAISLVNKKIYDIVHMEGDLTQRLDIKSGDELELIADNVNELLSYIREIMIKISENSDKLMNANKHMAGKMSEAEGNVADVSERMRQMSAAMQESSVTLNEIKQSISEIDGQMIDFNEQATKGNKLSADAVSKSVEISENVHSEKSEAQTMVSEMKAQMEEKIEKSRAVEQISLLTEEILDITEQTKLLALNAAIEAAASGEAGKGFAVVAGEMSKLADNSAAAAEQISHVSIEVVNSVNELANKASQMVEFMNEVTMKGYDKLIETSEGYSDYIRQLNDMMTAFAIESDELRKTTNIVNDSIDSINDAVEASSKDIANVAGVSDSLADGMLQVKEDAISNKYISDDLDIEVNKFKLY